MTTDPKPNTGPAVLSDDMLAGVIGGAATTGATVESTDDDVDTDAALKKLPGKRKPPTLTLKRGGS